MTLFRRAIATAIFLCSPFGLVAQSAAPQTTNNKVPPRSGGTVIQLAHELVTRQQQPLLFDPVGSSASWNTRAGKDRVPSQSPARGPQLPFFVGDDRYTRGHVNTAECKPGCACVAVRNIPGIISNQSDLDKKTKPKR